MIKKAPDFGEKVRGYWDFKGFFEKEKHQDKDKDKADADASVEECPKARF